MACVLSNTVIFFKVIDVTLYWLGGVCFLCLHVLRTVSVWLLVRLIFAYEGVYRPTLELSCSLFSYLLLERLAAGICDVFSVT